MLITDNERKTKDLIICLATTIKTTQLHQFNNVAVINARQKLLTIINSLLSQAEITLELKGEFFYVNGTRVRYSMDYIFNYDFLIREFKKRPHGTGLGLTITQRIIQEHKGRITVENLSGKLGGHGENNNAQKKGGTIFKIHLPLD